MGVSVDGFINDRTGDFGWTVPSDEQFRFHIEQVRGLGAVLCGRKLYETMLPWETDPAMRDTEDHAAFADVWCALPKVVVGGGTPYLPPVTETVQFELIETRTFGSRVIFERYRRSWFRSGPVRRLR